jgi:hypothetical protein
MVAAGDAESKAGEYNVRMGVSDADKVKPRAGYHDAEWAGARCRTLVAVIVTAPVHSG